MHMHLPLRAVKVERQRLETLLFSIDHVNSVES